jgi:hypothetical protein
MAEDGILVKGAKLVEKGMQAGQDSGIVAKTRGLIGAGFNLVGNFIQPAAPEQPENPEQDSEGERS